MQSVYEVPIVRHTTGPNSQFNDAVNSRLTVLLTTECAKRWQHNLDPKLEHKGWNASEVSSTARGRYRLFKQSLRAEIDRIGRASHGIRERVWTGVETDSGTEISDAIKE